MLQKLFNLDWQITSKSFLLSSFLIGFSFSPTAEISSLELEFEESLPRKPRQREDWTGVKWSSQSRKTHFLTLPDLAFGFIHKRSGNEINEDPLLKAVNQLNTTLQITVLSCFECSTQLAFFFLT